MSKRVARREREREPVVWAYTRVSTEEQSVEAQEREILHYANSQRWTVQRFVSLKVSSRKSEKQRRIEELKEAADAGQFNVLVVSELSRLGRGNSIGEIVRLIEFFTEHGVAVHCVKERIDTSKDDLTTDIQISIFAMMAKIERRLCSERTKAALAVRKASGVKLGRPKGQSKLNPYEDEIRQLIELRVPQTAIAERYDCHPLTLGRWLKTKRAEWRAQGGPSQ